MRGFPLQEREAAEAARDALEDSAMSLDGYHLDLVARKLEIALAEHSEWRLRELLRILIRGNVAEAEHPRLRAAADAARQYLTARRHNRSS